MTRPSRRRARIEQIAPSGQVRQYIALPRVPLWRKSNVVPISYCTDVFFEGAPAAPAPPFWGRKGRVHIRGAAPDFVKLSDVTYC
jgi:hypothetical protein